MIKPVIYNGEKAEALFGAREEASDKAEQTVKAIISDVRDRGDAALREYSVKFDGYTGAELEVTQAESDRAEREVAPEFKKRFCAPRTTYALFTRGKSATGSSLMRTVGSSGKR